VKAVPGKDAVLAAIVAGGLVLLLVFVSYRAQTFHYCVGSDERAQRARLADSKEPCRADERPTDWPGLWRQEGLHSKLKMLVNTTSEAFGAN
jgi:hypothetical protein